MKTVFYFLSHTYTNWGEPSDSAMDVDHVCAILYVIVYGQVFIEKKKKKNVIRGRLRVAVTWAILSADASQRRLS